MNNMIMVANWNTKKDLFCTDERLSTDTFISDTWKKHFKSSKRKVLDFEYNKQISVIERNIKSFEDKYNENVPNESMNYSHVHGSVIKHILYDIFCEKESFFLKHFYIRKIYVVGERVEFKEKFDLKEKKYFMETKTFKEVKKEMFIYGFDQQLLSFIVQNYPKKVEDNPATFEYLYHMFSETKENKKIKEKKTNELIERCLKFANEYDKKTLSGRTKIKW